MEIIRYKRGEEVWGINIMPYSKGTVYTAVTACTSKDFKTFKGADKYMTAHGYKRI